MRAEQEFADQPEPRVCQRCGSPLPLQKTGRPRRWCSPQCRQAAYEQRHGLESWKDKQPKVGDLSDVVEVVQDRAARRGATRRRAVTEPRSAHTLGDCVSAVCADQSTMAMVIDAVADLISDQQLVNTSEGRFLAGGVARLVEVVHMVAFRLVPTDVPPASTRPRRGNN
jgi:hypothetical protein